MKKKKEWKKIILVIFSGILCLIFGFILWINLSPNPTISLVRGVLFSIPQENRPNSYRTNNDRVSVTVSDSYTSKYKRNTFDVYSPIKALKDNPTILWVHGGGFIGGDKLEEKEYASQLAEEGYTVLVMNYELVPEAKYPEPIYQVSDFVRYLEENISSYQINLNNLFIAGDSAGAQIAGQFTALQTNPSYSNQVDIAPVLEPAQIKGALLYCGPFNMIDVVESSQSPIVKFAFKNIGWSYFNTKNWLTSEAAKTASVTDNISSDFPPSYITDGNTASFEEQSKKLIRKLEDNKVPVKQRFFEIQDYKTGHEYQFDLQSAPGKLAYADTLEFLETYRDK